MVVEAPRSPLKGGASIDFVNSHFYYSKYRDRIRKNKFKAIARHHFSLSMAISTASDRLKTHHVYQPISPFLSIFYIKVNAIDLDSLKYVDE